MLKKIQKKYPGCLTSKTETDHPEHYLWIHDENKNTLGIPKSQLTVQEIELLRTLFPNNIIDFIQKEQQKKWLDFLTKRTASSPITSWKRVRFFYFTVSTVQFSQVEFEVAISSFFNENTIIIWESQESGFILDGSIDEVELITLRELRATLESDFYAKVRLYIGKSHTIDPTLPDHFMNEKTCFQIGLENLNDRHILQLKTIFPYLLLQKANLDKNWLTEQLLQTTRDDKELIRTVKTYIECNSNATLTAKKLFIHRNSLQYRIDKFIEATSLDIKNFHDAMVAYLAIQMNEKM
ncbi:PucR family transcriptional regulator [Peribacillus tepidiphilus]|uniref:PucR family transcriptional regulator n=1 Tax=Peribacillus tepidiphilus TaxID=2652445 RepID=UPI0035B53225